MQKGKEKDEGQHYAQTSSSSSSFKQRNFDFFFLLLIALSLSYFNALDWLYYYDRNDHSRDMNPKEMYKNILSTNDKPRLTLKTFLSQNHKFFQVSERSLILQVHSTPVTKIPLAISVDIFLTKDFYPITEDIHVITEDIHFITEDLQCFLPITDINSILDISPMFQTTILKINLDFDLYYINIKYHIRYSQSKYNQIVKELSKFPMFFTGQNKLCKKYHNNMSFFTKSCSSIGEQYKCNIICR